jgi:hypothetical protein
MQSLEEILASNPMGFRTHTKDGRMRREVMRRYLEHVQKNEIPTSGRFIFYELEHDGVVKKGELTASGKQKRVDAPVINALTWLRDEEYIPWDHIVDETRDVIEAFHYPTVREHMASVLERATVSIWHPEPAPFVICESRSIRGAISRTCSEFQVPLAAVNGNCKGFIKTKLRAEVESSSIQQVLYLGDWDYAGKYIQANTKTYLEEALGYGLEWERVALTQGQVEDRHLPSIIKKDGREAWECETLGQGLIVELLTEHLEKLMPVERRNGVASRAVKERMVLMQMLDVVLGGEHANQ